MSLAPWQQSLIQQLADLRIHEVLALVRQRLDQGEDPLTIAEVCQTGMRQVGERYERQEYFLAGLIMAGEIFRGVMELIQPQLETRFQGESRGQVLIGTVHGDIHDIGKNLLLALLRCNGFRVQDLGIDVPPEEFVRYAQATRPDVVGLSGLLTTTYDVMRDTTRLLRTAPELTARPPAIMIGGGVISAEVGDYVEADFCTTDAMEGVRFCQRIVAASRGTRTL